jgi:hypothetical protein
VVAQTEAEHDSVLSNGELKSEVNSASSQKSTKTSSAKSARSMTANENVAMEKQVAAEELVQEAENDSDIEVSFKIPFFVWS